MAGLPSSSILRRGRGEGRESDGMDIHLKRLRSRPDRSRKEEAIRALPDDEQEGGPDRTIIRANDPQRESRTC